MENIDDSSRTLSVTDEFEANKAVINLYQSSISASSIYADIKRNSYLQSVRNAPQEMTPDKNMKFHQGIKKSAIDQLNPLYRDPKDQK